MEALGPSPQDPVALPFALFLERYSIDDDAVDPAARLTGVAFGVRVEYRFTLFRFKSSGFGVEVIWDLQFGVFRVFLARVPILFGCFCSLSPFHKP